MSTRKLSFYDHHRQRYHDAVWNPEHGAVVGEFMVGDYVKSGGVDKRGELTLVLYDFDHNRYDGSKRALNIQIQCFDDAYGTLHEMERLGVLRAIETSEIRTRDDLTNILLTKGLRDRSDNPVEKVIA